MALAASVVYSLYIIISRKTLITVDTQVLTAHVLLFATLGFFIIGTFTHQLRYAVPFSGWVLLFGIAVTSTAILSLLFFAGVSRIGAGQASIVSTSEPVFTVLQGILLLNERFTMILGIGDPLILGGVVIVEVEYTKSSNRERKNDL